MGLLSKEGVEYAEMQSAVQSKTLTIKKTYWGDITEKQTSSNTQLAQRFQCDTIDSGYFR